MYIPLGGSKVALWKQIRNTFIIFILSGFWHGAQWTFICLGVLNALYFMPLLLFRNNRKHIDIVAPNSLFPGFREALSIALTFILTMIAWVFFRAQDMQHAWLYLKGMFSKTIFQVPNIQNMPKALMVLAFIGLFTGIEWLGRRHTFALEGLTKQTKGLQYLIYLTLILVIFVFAGSPQQFIYFQF